MVQAKFEIDTFYHRERVADSGEVSQSWRRRQRPHQTTCQQTRHSQSDTSLRRIVRAGPIGGPTTAGVKFSCGQYPTFAWPSILLDPSIRDMGEADVHGRGVTAILGGSEMAEPAGSSVMNRVIHPVGRSDLPAFWPARRRARTSDRPFSFWLDPG